MPDGFVPVAKASELMPGQMKWVAVNGERRVLANVEGKFYAIFSFLFGFGFALQIARAKERGDDTGDQAHKPSEQLALLG